MNTVVTPLQLFKCLSHGTRLKIMMLIAQHGELCVCELAEALDESQPKISRHLSLLKKHSLIQDRRQGQWIFYHMHDRLPAWAGEILQRSLQEHLSLLVPVNAALENMARPIRYDSYRSQQ